MQGPLVVPDLLRARVEDDPEGVALVVHGGEALDYAGWDRSSDAVARSLKRQGVAKGHRVGLLFDNARWTHYAVAYVGVLKIGAVAVPLAPRFTSAELAGVLALCEASGVVAASDQVATVPSGPWWVRALDDLPDDEGPPPVPAPGAMVSPDDLAEILYTSGTTGTPKGVACSHANLMFHELPPDASGASPTVSFLHAFPVGTNAGQEVLRLPLRRTGRVAVALPVFDPEQLCLAVNEHRVTRLQLVPAMAQVILDSGAHRRHDLTSIERLTLSSAPTPPALLSRLAEAFPEATLCNAYALTESGTARTLLVGSQDRPGSVGRPVGRTEVAVVDDDDRDLPAGVTGEIWLRHPDAPRREYYRDPEATAGALAPGGWLRTGDLGHLDEEGFLYLDDRKKDIIISGGANISPVEVESVLLDHPAVTDAAVVGVPHPVLGQDVSAAVVLRSPATARQLQAFVRTRLSEHKVPHRVVVVDELPRNASGKVLKRELPAIITGKSDSGDKATAGASEAAAAHPSWLTPTQETVLALWQEVLGQGEFGPHDDFFELGGHSLAAAQVAARLQEAYALDLPVTVVFEHPTVAELAEVVEEAQEFAMSQEAGRQEAGSRDRQK